MKRQPRILVVGSLVMDLISTTHRFPESGETVIGDHFRTAPGGKGANQALQAARLGADVTMIGKVGNDDYGKQLLRSLTNDGVEVSGVSIDKECPSGIGNVQLEKINGTTRNRILVIPGANMRITIEDILPLKQTIRTYDMVILQLEIPMEINLAVAKISHENGVPVMLNSAPSAPLPAELLSCLTYLSPNEHEAADITGITIRKENGVVNAEDIHANIAALRKLGVKNALITLGNNGVVFGNEHEYIHSPSVDVVEVKDPTAAGDSFVGAFCTAVCAGIGHRDALEFANHVAGLTVSRMGAQPSLPTLAEVLSLMDSRNCPCAKTVREMLL